MSSRHVYDHGTLGLVQANTHLLLFKANYQPPDNSKVYLSISTNGCHPQLFFSVVPDYYSLPFYLVLDRYICSRDLIPECLVGIPCTLSSRSVSSRSNTLPYKTLNLFSFLLKFIKNKKSRHPSCGNDFVLSILNYVRFFHEIALVFLLKI